MNGKTILLAEDEEILAIAIQMKLTKAGLRVKAVTNGVDVLKELEKGGYDLLLLDILMPEKNGFEVLEEMQSKTIKTPVVVTSNLSDDKDINLAKKLGAVDYLIKTDFSLDEIVEKVLKYLCKIDNSKFNESKNI